VGPFLQINHMLNAVYFSYLIGILCPDKISLKEVVNPYFGTTHHSTKYYKRCIRIFHGTPRVLLGVVLTLLSNLAILRDKRNFLRKLDKSSVSGR